MKKEGYHFNPDIFKYNFPSGFFDTEITIQDVYFLGKVLGSIATGPLIPPDKKPIACVAYDGHLNGSLSEQELVRGLMTAGIRVLKMGVVPTPVVMFTAHDLKVDLAIIITAESSAANKIGFKIFFKGLPLSQKEKMHIFSLAASGNWYVLPGGKYIPTDALQAYSDYLIGHYSLNHDITAVWDCSYGASGMLLETMTKALPGTHHIINHTPHHDFNHIPPDHFEPTALKILAQHIISKQADVGFRFNADASAMSVVDRQGHRIGEETLFLLLARSILTHNPKAILAFDIFTSPQLIGMLNIPEQQILYIDGDWESFYARREEKVNFYFSCEGRFLIGDPLRKIEGAIATALYIIGLVKQPLFSSLEVPDFLPVTQKYTPAQNTHIVKIFETFIKNEQHCISQERPGTLLWQKGKYHARMRIDVPGNNIWLRIFGENAQAEQRKLCDYLKLIENHI